MGGNLNRNVVYGGGAAVIILLVILVWRSHQPAPAVPAPNPPSNISTPQAVGSTAHGSELAQDSTDPNTVSFMDSFKTSAVNSCKASVVTQAQAANKPLTDETSHRVEQFCNCAARQVAATITVSEVANMTVEAVSQGLTTSDTIKAVKARMTTAGASCLTNTTPEPRPPPCCRPGGGAPGGRPPPATA